MRKPRDYDSELKALADKAKLLKERRARQLGELVIACRADTLDIDVLAGALLAASTTTDAAIREGWRTAGMTFFRKGGRSAARGPQSRARGASPDDRGAKPTAGETGAA